MSKDIFGTIVTSVGEAFAALNKPQQLAAIWLDKAVVTSEGRKIRISPGVGVKIENGKLVNLPEGENPTHIVLECYGAMSHSFSIKVSRMADEVIETINL